MSFSVLVLNGSPHIHGCTARALDEAIGILNKEGIETKLVQIGNESVRGCMGCKYCKSHDSGCVMQDKVNEVAELLKDADGLLIGSPVHYGSPDGTLLALLDRLFYSSSFSKQMKVGAALVSCRRGGATASFDVLNKYFTISGMPIASGTYWNQVHGFSAEDVEKDLEGLQTIRNMARNMAFLIKAIAAEKTKNGLPEVEKGAYTSFPDGK